MGKVGEAQTLGQRILAAAQGSADRNHAQAFLEDVSRRQTYLAEKKLREENERREAEEWRRSREELRKRPEQSGLSPSTDETIQKNVDSPNSKTPLASVDGRIISVKCDRGNLNLTLEYQGYLPQFHSGNSFKIKFFSTGWQPPADFNPCSHLEGRIV